MVIINITKNEVEQMVIRFPGGIPDKSVKGGGRDGGLGRQSPKKCYFRPFGPQSGLKIREERASRAPPLDPPLPRVFGTESD